MPNNAKNFLVKEALKEILVKVESISEQLARIIRERQRLEWLRRRRETEIDLLKATIFIKVHDDLADGKPRYPDQKRQESEVFCRLAYDPAYRRAVNSIQRAEIKLARLKAEEIVLQTQTNRLQSEERLLFHTIEKSAYGGD